MRPQPWMAFLAGFAIGMVVLSVLGAFAGSMQTLERFVRFHRYINPEGLYYPTASQVVALAREHATTGSVLVIVGGDSLFFGTGQSTSGLWSRALQDELGSDYDVLNLAFPSGGYQEHGAVAAQQLLGDGHKVLFLGDAFPGYAVPPDGYQYPYVFWDAYYKGLLLHPDERTAQAEQDYQRSAKTDQLIELQAHYRLDSVLHFGDLWNYVAYNYLFTVWNQFAGAVTGNFLLPRRLYADPLEDYTPPPPEVRYSAAAREVELPRVRALALRGCDRDGTGALIPYEASAFWRQVRDYNGAALPQELRERSVMVLNYWSTVYREQLTGEERDCFGQVYAEAARALTDAGFQVVLTGADYADEDYHDRIHLTDSGGRKLARDVAPEIRKLAQAMGYVPGER